MGDETVSEKKRCVIVGGADIGDYARVKQYLREDDAVVFCDSGLKHMEALGVKPALIVGDFDSHCNPHLDVETIVLPCEKDDTDTVFAVKTMVQRGYDDFLLIGVIGARLDHTLANLQSLAFLLRHRARGYLYDQNFVYTAIENETLTLTREGEWGIVSLFSMGDRAEHITLEGLQYPLTDGTIDCGFPLGVSNEITDDYAEIEVREGRLLVVLSGKETAASIP